MAFDGSTYKRCKCTALRLDVDGKPVLHTNGTPKTYELGSACPNLDTRGHGSWYYYVKLPDGPRGERRRPRKGGFVTQKDAQTAAQKLWDIESAGVDTSSKETVAEYLHRWHRKRVDLKRGTSDDYKDYIDRVFIPALGHLKLIDLRTEHIQAMFEDIWAYNEVKAANRLTAQHAEAEAKAAHAAWKAAPKPRPHHYRQRWDAARAALKEARAQPRQDTGPGRQKKYLDTLSGALAHAVREKSITENWCDEVILPKYEKPEPLVWTDARVARWRETGEIPGPVMVWTPQQIGEFLDAAVHHILYPMWHIMAFRAPRRGEAVGLPWAETDMVEGYIEIVETIATGGNTYGSYEDTPKSRASKRGLKLDSASHALLLAWRDVQQEQRWEWEAKHREDPEKYGPYVDSGKVFTMADGHPWNPRNVSQAFIRLIKRLGLPPIRLHDLRHCAASLSLAAGLSMKAIQALLGHSSYSLTADTYTSLMPQFEKEAADAALGLVPRAGQAPAPEPPTPDPDKTRAEAKNQEPPALALVPDQPSSARAA
ncbi:tyrosine-type recombinase/integrase [Streptomyces sp. NPDC058657]|uniref:tyrosine-type recombinase/integrase n=1 Tax=unclassified Streptomyces TaxID=2593676 RepID=UPI00365368F6